MNIRKILGSVFAIGVVAIVAVMATQAFFSDTETSTGNIFQAGAIDLLIDNESYYTDPETGQFVSSLNTSWTLENGDLTDQLFFNFFDLKPGDLGEDTISLHANNNDAWLCAAARITEDSDVDYTEPELNDDQTVNENDPVGSDGELAEQLNFVFWADDGDNVYENDENIFVQQGPASNVLGGTVVALADSETNIWEQTPGPVNGGDNYYIGKAWCFGDLNVVAHEASGTALDPLQDNLITCNGQAVDNAAQTDRVRGDLQFYAVQSRNNSGFLCSQYTPQWPEEELVIADSYETGFEPTPAESFVVGNIDGQDGWKKTGPYDAAVVSSPVIADVQSLRISNGYADGAFGGQTFAPELVSSAGESTVAPENHFEAEFDIKTTELSQQPGLAISVSPDDGLGSRMSYLGFADEAAGVRVTFYDVTNSGGLGTVSSFDPTDLGLLDRSTAHTIKFVMDFEDGPDNDVVKIYIDGVLAHTGGSWEDYYRYDPEQSGNGNTLFEVDSLIFAARGSSVPANLGKGFLIDKVSLLSGTI